MELFSIKDLKEFDKRIDDIEFELERRADKELYPTLEFKKKVANIVLDFVKENKRKIYGGTAQNMVIIDKNKEDAIYDEHKAPDIDFYSPDPIVDAMKLVNIFVKQKYDYIVAQEAQHPETYTVFVDFEPVADITYVPANIYHRIPFIEIDGIQYVAPKFIMIDLLKMFSDPLTSGSLRWKKTFCRMYKLQKNYPIYKPKKAIPVIDEYDDEALPIINTINQFIQNNTNCILVGDYVYNVYLDFSKISKDSKLGKKYKTILKPVYELVLLNYVESGKQLYELIRSNHSDLLPDIQFVEYQPFGIFWGNSMEVKFRGKIVCRLIDHAERCIPIKVHKSVQIGSYDYNLLHSFILIQKYRTNNNKDLQNRTNVMISHLVEMKDYYLKKVNKSLFDDTLFQQLVTTCIGETVDFRRKRRLIVEDRKARNKPFSWRYPPTSGKLEDDPKSDFKFDNTSGNEIKSLNYMKILKDK
jgi:hypothetical protein